MGRYCHLLQRLPYIAFIILLIISSICFVVALIGIYLDYRDARRKDRETKAAKVRGEIEEGIRELNERMGH